YGGPCGWPIRVVKALRDESCEPKPGCVARGPVCPMLLVLSIISSGLNSRNFSYPRPSLEITPGRMFSITTSDQSTNAYASSRPSEHFKLSVMPFFESLKNAKHPDRFSPTFPSL